MGTVANKEPLTRNLPKSLISFSYYVKYTTTYMLFMEKNTTNQVDGGIAKIANALIQRVAGSQSM